MAKWTEPELEIMDKYFTNTWTLQTLAMRINKVNPDRTFEAVARKQRRMREELNLSKHKERFLDSLRVGYFDIEATNLSANYGHVLCWYIKPHGSNKFDKGVVTRKELVEDYTFDKRIIKELLEAFQNYDILYTHYGGDRRYDLPYIRTRALLWGYEDLLPKRGEKFIRDTWVIARNKLKLSNNRLDTVAEALNLSGDGAEKTRITPHHWLRASVGEKKALQYVEEHNRIDVILLEQIMNKLKYIENPTLTSM